MRVHRLAAIGACTVLLVGCARTSNHQQSSAAAGAREPAVSPDGKTIAICLGGGIWVMPVAGGVARQVTTGAGNDWHPIWSPDGKTLAFLSDRSGSSQTWTVSADGGAPQQLTSDPAQKSNSAWSPDGSLIAFTTSTGQWRYGVRAVSVKDRSIRDLIESDADYAAWSPDGSRLAFARRSEERNYDIWVKPIAGGPPTRVTNDEGMEFQPAWSPDGRQIAYTSYTYVAGKQGATDVFVVSADGSTPRRLTDSEEAEFDPVWTKDGRAIIFTTNVSGNTEFRSIPAAGGPAAPLAVAGRTFLSGSGGRLKLTVTEAGQQVPCRISVQASDGKFYTDDGRFFRIANTGSGFFHSEGTATVDLPAGPVKVWATRGLEYRIAEQTVEIPAGGTRDLTVALERWVDMVSKGWYSGDNHIHSNYTILDYRNVPEDIVLMAKAEDLNVANLLVADFGGTPSFDWIEGFWDQKFFEGRPNRLSQGRTILYWNQEFRSTVYGHMSLINLRQLVTPLFSGFRGTPQFEDYPPNADIADLTHAQGGVVSYVHPFFSAQSDAVFGHYDAPEFKPEWNLLPGYEALELPVDIALGKVEALDLATRLDTFDLTALIYRRLLNCGFRFAVGAGTDVYADQKQNPPVGIERVYAHSANPFSYSSYIEGMQAGRTFVTNGPMVELSVNGQPIGATLKLDAPGLVTVKASARGQFPIEQMRIFLNGVAVETVRATGDRLQVAFEGPVHIPRSAWLAVQVDGPKHAMLLSNNPLSAHSSPVYVLVRDQPIASAIDARFFITWIDKLWELVDGRNRWRMPEQRKHVRDLFTRAKDVYRRVAASDPTARAITRR
jgi:TolB protein